MDHLGTVARRKVGGSPEWEYFKWERVGEGRDFIVEGGIPRLLKSGPRKGEKTWKDCACQKTIVSGAEIDAEHARYEAETGKCGDCGGTGEVFSSWRAGEGTKMKPCKRCNATGKTPNAEVSGAGTASAGLPG